MSVWFPGESLMKVLVPWISGLLPMICVIYIHFSDRCARDTTGFPGECWNMATQSVSPALSDSSIMLTHGAMACLIVI